MPEINGNGVTVGPVAKWLASGLSVIIIGWLSWSSIYLLNVSNDLSNVSRDLSVLVNDVSWLKNEANRGGRFTAETGAEHKVMIDQSRECCVENRERIIRIEATHDKDG